MLPSILFTLDSGGSLLVISLPSELAQTNPIEELKSHTNITFPISSILSCYSGRQIMIDIARAQLKNIRKNSRIIFDSGAQ